ncbi:hypothetical protein Angca_002282, partial [Angiostrongylus cantonensis]
EKKTRLKICNPLLIRNDRDPFLSRIITCDEKWRLTHDACQTETDPKKTMVSVLWSMAGIIHYKSLRHGETITSEKLVLKSKKCSKDCASNSQHWSIEMDQYCFMRTQYVSQITLRKLNEMNYELLPHQLYSPDLSTTDFHFYKHLDRFVKGKIFNDQTTLENAFKELIDTNGQVFY